jgi:serine phosphatase RsbU (regulator of sigma subunit)
MSLRLRLIVAFFALSVVPLGAVTFLTYRSNVTAVQDAAANEADLLAGELSQRMQLITTQLSERVEHLMDLPAQAAATETKKPTARVTVVAGTPTPAGTTAADAASAEAMNKKYALQLGEAAMLLNNVELRGIRPPSGDSRQGRPPSRSGDPGGRGGGSGRGRGGSGGAPPAGVSASRGDAPSRGVPGPTGPGAPGTAAAADATTGIRIDLAPIRRELLQQMMPQGQFETLTAEERQRLTREVNQRLLGIQQGIQLGAAELKKKAEDAQREVDAQAKAAAAAAAKGEAAVAPLKKKTALSGNRLDVRMERDGQVVQQVNAEINLPNVLETVFSTTRRERGEVPFAVEKDGHLHAPTEADRKKIDGLGDALRPDGPPTRTTIVGDWIVVTTADPSGSGLRFGIARPVGDSMNALRRTAARNASLGLLFIGLAIAGIVPLSGRLLRNLSTLTEGVGRIAQGDYGARVSVKSHDEIGRLAGAFNQMAEDVLKHQRSAVGQERIRRELELGRQIQNEMLPHAPMRLGLTEIQGVSVPAREVGGDFFNYFEVGDGQIALLVGDVSGKGVGAALLMANIQAALRTRLSLGRDLSSIADAIDRDIEANSPGPVYATLFVGILDPAVRRLRYINAGHHPQYVLRRRGGLDRMASTGLPVGLLAGRGYSEGTVQLDAGDLIFFYTDGCVEAENDAGDMFGAERLEALLTSHAASGPADVMQRVENGVTAFRGACEPFDDETMMAVKVG